MLRVSFDELVADVWVCPEAAAVLRDWAAHSGSGDEQLSKWQLEGRMRIEGELYRLAVELPPLDTLTAEVKAHLAATHKRWDELEQRWRELEAAPQLFIAA
jgi:hypothetical protein